MHPAHRHHHDPSDLCSCRNCVKIPLQNGNSIDRLYYNKQIPLRERQLLEKLVRTRAVYEDIRCRILSSDSSIDDYKVDSTVNNRRNDIRVKGATEINPIHRLVNLVDRGELPQLYSPVNLHSECCSCCFCGPKTRVISTQSKVRVHIPSLEHVNLTHHGNKRKRALYHPSIRSDLCICPSKFNTKLKISSDDKQDVQLIPREQQSIESIQETDKIIQQPLSKKNKVKCLCPSKIYAKVFHIKKDSITLFKEKLQRKSQKMEHRFDQWNSDAMRSNNKAKPNNVSLKQKLLRVVCKCKKQTKSTVSMANILSIIHPSMQRFTNHLSLPLAREYNSKVLLKRSWAANKMARCFCTLQEERPLRRLPLRRYTSNLGVPSSSTASIKPHSVGTTKKTTKTKNVKCLCEIKETVSTSTQSSNSMHAPVFRPQSNLKAHASPSFKRHKFISLSASKAPPIHNEIRVPKHRKRMLRPKFEETPYAVKSKSFPYGLTRQFRRSNSSFKYDEFFNNYPDAKIQPKYKESIENALENSVNRHSMATVVNYVMPPQTVPKKLLPYECEPNFCIPGQCDPYVCEKRIKRRNLIPNKILAITKCLCNPKRQKKQHEPDRKKYASLPNREHYGEPYANENERPIAPHRQVVKLSSNFRIELEISRRAGQSDRPSLKYNDYRTDRKDGKIMKHYRQGHRKPYEYRPQMQNEWSQAPRSIQELESRPRTIALNPLLKKCLCTLKFHTTGSPIGGRNSSAVIPLHRKTKKTGTMLNRKVLPYECEPGVCLPGQCDPYVCLKRIESRNMRNVKYRTKDVNTIRPKKRSVYISSRGTVNQESQSSTARDGVKRKNKKDERKKKKECKCECKPNLSRRISDYIHRSSLIHPRLKQLPRDDASLHLVKPQPAVKLSSQISFSLEFSRNKRLTNEDMYEDKYAFFKEAERNRRKAYERYYENKKLEYPTGTNLNENSHKSFDDGSIYNGIKRRSTKPHGIHYVNRGMSTKGDNRPEISQKELKRAYKYDNYPTAKLERCFCTLDLMKMYDQQKRTQRGRRL